MAVAYLQIRLVMGRATGVVDEAKISHERVNPYHRPVWIEMFGIECLTITEAEEAVRRQLAIHAETSPLHRAIQQLLTDAAEAPSAARQRGSAVTD